MVRLQDHTDFLNWKVSQTALERPDAQIMTGEAISDYLSSLFATTKKLENMERKLCLVTG